MGSTELQNSFWQFPIFLESEDIFQKLFSPTKLLAYYA